MAAERCVRIHVGGLRGGVAAEDVEKTFSSLGRVSRVELVSRPEGRSFAYMDFEPSSDQSLAKLFATYNGCIWKGGKLKLGKAKEHYIDRLRREWAEAAEIVKNEHNDNHAKKDSQVLEKAKFMPQENTQLRIFFPKFNKVKMLPFKGTGKHKYSFQRVEIPSLPIHFCDCEEHCRPFAPVSFSNFATSNNKIGGIDEKEISVMNSVLKKLFGKEIDENVVDEGLSSATQANILECCVNDSQLSEKQEAEETDEDNFVMNIGTGESNAMLDLFQAKRWGEIAGNQDAKNKTSTEVILDKQNSRKRQKTGANSLLDLTPKTKADQSHSEANGIQKEFISVEPGKKRFSKILSQELQDYSKTPTDQCQSHQNPAPIQSAGGPSWKQKSSWKELIVGAKVGTFSMSHLLPSVQSVKSKSPKSLDASSKAQMVTSQSDEYYLKHSEVEAIRKEKPVETHCDKEKLKKDGAITNKTENEQNAAVGEENDGNSNINNQLEVPSVATGKQSISEIHPQVLQDSLKVPADQCQLNQNPATDQSTRGSFWLHKSSWTALAGDTNVSTFSISQLVPGIDKVKPKSLKPCASASSSKDKNVGSQSDGVTPKKVTETRKAVDRPSNEEKLKKDGDTINSAENSQHSVQQKSDENSKSNGPPIVIGQVCTFMRNANSEKQWTKARAAVRAQLNRTSKTVASKGSRGWS